MQYNPGDIDIKMAGTAGGTNHNKIIIWSDIVVPSTGNGAVIDISSAGFTTITNVQLTVESASSSVATIPLIALKSYTNTQVVCNLLVSGSTTVSLLGAIVNGLTFATNLTAVKVHIRVEGY